jgi:hypothetical protein
MQHEVDKFKGAHEEISLRLFRQGKEPKGKKILIHPLRVLGSSPLPSSLSLHSGELANACALTLVTTVCAEYTLQILDKGEKAAS